VNFHGWFGNRFLRLFQDPFYGDPSPSPSANIEKLLATSVKTGLIPFYFSDCASENYLFYEVLECVFSSSAVAGKPAAADLQLGLATAPVLFATAKFPELNAMIERRFRCVVNSMTSLGLQAK
jgi:hypothetical protein